MQGISAAERHVQELERELRGANAERRLSLQPELDRAMKDLETTGTAIPARLRNLHEQLLEEAIEARFDNLPI